jgi:hypothetical protein
MPSNRLGIAPRDPYAHPALSDECLNIGGADTDGATDVQARNDAIQDELVDRALTER